MKYSALLNVTCLVALSLCVGLAGCDKSPQLGTVAGKVTLDGQPVKTGRIAFVSNEAAGASGMAPIQADGSYEVKIGEAKGLPAAKYKVSLLPPIQEGDVMATKPVSQGPPFDVPKKYLNADQSGLTIEVKAGENPPFNFDLQK
jgi:hypothetical protein